jgi:hypothetical protein
LIRWDDADNERTAWIFIPARHMSIRETKNPPGDAAIHGGLFGESLWKCSALRELEAFASSGLTVFLAFLHTGITGQASAGLEDFAE